MSLSFAFSIGDTDFLDFEMEDFEIDLLDFDHLPPYRYVSDTTSEGKMIGTHSLTYCFGISYMVVLLSQIPTQIAAQ